MLFGRSARDILLPRGEDPYRSEAESLGGPMLFERDILGVPLEIGATIIKGDIWKDSEWKGEVEKQPHTHTHTQHMEL